MTTQALCAGQYFIGDPCYVIADDKWDHYLETAFWPAEHQGAMVFPYDGHMMFATHTAHGDGVYFDDDGNEYPVDSGTIACVPIELCTKINIDQMNECGLVVKATESFEVDYDEGVYTIGAYTIYTDFDQ